MNATSSPGGRTRLLAYVPWLFRDYATNQGPSTAIVVLLIAYLALLPVLKGGAGPAMAMGDVPPEIAKRVLQALFPPLVFLGTFFATNGIIANDRKFSYYRFLFAKPMNPLAYYSTVFVVYGIGLLGVSCALFGLWAAVVRPVSPLELFLIVPVMYIAYGGIGFLLSAAWRFDWISLVTVILVANIGWDNWGTAEHPLHYLLYLLPPVHRATAVYSLDVGSSGIPWGAMAWLGGYGAVCFVLGLVVLRKRPMGTS